MKTSLALIGFMGAGKTAVGRVLAERLNKEFVELDTLIEEKAGKSIPEIFEQDGEIAFRELEIAVTRLVAEKKNQVIACGGGLILNRINVDRLKKEAVMVYLSASPDEVLKRTQANGDNRPLLDVSDRRTEIAALMRFREPFYERAADIKIDAAGLDVPAVAETIMAELKENESFPW